MCAYGIGDGGSADSFIAMFRYLCSLALVVL